ncbi:LAMI_0G04082g1_1 [Lachancea mirantina]|uniref:LAMI_0G04082g1_1 n=1 Tax=Lachancea mirantina TaxID=1230905 RepID=A0A1G4K8C8_9SACH|nr:LAMI_0G04082g1_1 [Lachancea mirantina]
MSERKAINKYYPPNYNPLEAERAARKFSKKLKTMNKDAVTIRLMTPFSMRCVKCSEFIPKSRKFNGKKESLPEKYLDTVKVYRLSIKCPRCNSLISFRTDPKTGDYVMEVGGVRNFVREPTADGVPTDETLDETLERLEKEQQRQNEMLKNEPAEDRLQQLEARLSKLQKEQQDYEELENLRRQNVLKMQRAESAASVATDATDAATHDEITPEEFEKRRLQLVSRETDPGALNKPLPTVHRTKPKIRTNKLGVVVKKRL